MFPWIVIGILLAMATGLFLAVRWGLLPEQPASPEMAPPPKAGIPQVPPPRISVPPPRIPEALTQHFPEVHEGFRLESIETRPAEGVLSGQWLAHYKDSVGKEAFVRLVQIRKNPQTFARQTLRELVGTRTVTSAGPLTPPKDSPWTAAHLFSRRGIGIYLVYNETILMTVSAESPEAARAFGETLEIRNP